MLYRILCKQQRTYWLLTSLELWQPGFCFNHICILACPQKSQVHYMFTIRNPFFKQVQNTANLCVCVCAQVCAHMCMCWLATCGSYWLSYTEKSNLLAVNTPPVTSHTYIPTLKAQTHNFLLASWKQTSFSLFVLFLLLFFLAACQQWL